MIEWRYAERILYVDLTARTARVEPTPVALKRDYIGGAGFVAKLLAEHEEAGATAGSPAVVLAAGPLSDEMAGRLALGAGPRPEGGIALSSLGGRVAAALKDDGYDAVLITGTLDAPACLLLDEDAVELLPADALWGQEVSATEERIFGTLGRGYATVVLGPAAENRVPFATLAHEGHYAGGSGVAAALGGKLLKALILRDRTGVPSRCTGCTLACPGRDAPGGELAGDLGLDLPTVQRLAALAQRCAEVGILPAVGEPLTDIALRRGALSLLADGEAAAIRRLGPAAQAIVATLPAPKRRGGPGIADLLGTCQRTWQERPGQVLREALMSTLGLVSTVA